MECDFLWMDIFTSVHLGLCCSQVDTILRTAHPWPTSPKYFFHYSKTSESPWWDGTINLVIFTGLRLWIGNLFGEKGMDSQTKNREILDILWPHLLFFVHLECISLAWILGKTVKNFLSPCAEYWIGKGHNYCGHMPGESSVLLGKCLRFRK